LQIATIILYLNAALAVLAGALGEPLFVLIVALMVGGAFGIANERKWGYALGIAAAVSPFALRIYYHAPLLGTSVLNLIFEIALIALLLHPMSRDYQRIWFK